jgi:urea transport system substrate-binding protein
MEATYIGFNMWAKAVEKAGTTDVDTVEQAMIGITTPNLTGGVAVMNKNHHLSKPVLIGEIQDDGQIATVWETNGTVMGDAWSNFLTSSKDLISDWTAPISCGNYNTKTAKCSGQNF